MRLIDADKLEDVLAKHQTHYYGDSDYYEGISQGFNLAIYDVKETPTIDAEPIRYGEWIGKPMIGGYSRMRCSVCDNVFLDNKKKWNYCPNCGARMVNENEDAD